MKTEKTDLSQENESDLLDGESEKTILTVDDKINYFIDRANLEALTPCMYVYKYKLNSSSVRSLCGKFEGEDIPDEHTIGLQYGSGRYLVIVQVPPGQKQDRKQCSFTFEIASTYDDLRRTAAATGTLPTLYSLPVRGAPVPSQVAAVDNMAIMRETMSFMAEMFGKMQGMQPAAPAVSPDFSSLMLQQYKGMGEVLKANLLQTDSFLQQALKNKMESGYNDSDTEEDNNDTPENTDQPSAMALLTALLPDILKMLPGLLASPKTAAIVQAATSPAAQQVAGAAIQQVSQGHRRAVNAAATRNLQLMKAKGKKIPPAALQKVKAKKTTIPSTVIPDKLPEGGTGV